MDVKDDSKGFDLSNLKAGFQFRWRRLQKDHISGVGGEMEIRCSVVLY